MQAFDHTSVAIPQRLASRPRDFRGYPIPAGVLVDSSGKPDFRVTDASRWVALVKSRSCALCGEPLGRHLSFVGGPLSHESRLFTDAPMHRDCATYALQVCPYLAAPNFRYAESLRVEQGVAISVAPEVSNVRPEKFFLGITRDFRALRTLDGTHVLHATAWEQVTWWRNGERLEG